MLNKPAGCCESVTIKTNVAGCFLWPAQEATSAASAILFRAAELESGHFHFQANLEDCIHATIAGRELSEVVVPKPPHRLDGVRVLSEGSSDEVLIGSTNRSRQLTVSAATSPPSELRPSNSAARVSKPLPVNGSRTKSPGEVTERYAFKQDWFRVGAALFAFAEQRNVPNIGDWHVLWPS